MCWKAWPWHWPILTISFAIIRNAPTPPVAKAELMTRSWDSKLVREMLTRTRADGGVINADDYRPEGLEEEFGMQARTACTACLKPRPRKSCRCACSA